MAIDLDFSDLDSCDLKSDILWEALYQFLIRRVRYWVQSSHVSFWRGQEEDIIADIVQETVTRTFTYSVKHTSWSKEGEVFPCNSLKRISMFIACSHYLELEQQDSRFVYRRYHASSSQRYAIIYERTDPLEIVADNVTQEWYCNLLAEAIVNIPVRPRTALLIDLANHTRFTSRPTKLQEALQRAGIQLGLYQQLLPDDPVVRIGYDFLLSFAYRLIMRKQERLEELENPEDIYSGLEPVIMAGHSDADIIQTDPELEALIARLEATAPRAAIDPAYKKALHDELLDIQAKHCVFGPIPIKEASGDVPEPTSAQDNIGAVDDDQNSASRDLVSDGIQTDPELEALIARLEATAPRAAIDPAYKKTLHDELLDIQAKHCVFGPIPIKEASGDVPEPTSAQDNIRAVDDDQNSASRDLVSDGIQTYKKALRDKLLDIQAENHVPTSIPIEEIPAETEKVLDSTSEESHHASPIRRRWQNH